jgi:hypothetical protein
MPDGRPYRFVLSKKRHKGVGENTHPSRVRMIDRVHQQRHVWRALTPKPAFTVSLRR